MADKIPLKAIPASGDATAIQELESGDSIGVAHGGTGKTTITADTFLYASALDTLSEASITTAGRAILDDADAEAQRTTLSIERTGTFTPAFADASSGGNEATFSSVTGNYTETDDYYDAIIEMRDTNTTGLTGTNIAYITGLPFTTRTMQNAFVRATGNIEINHFTPSTNLISLSVDCSSATAYLIIRESISGVGPNAATVNQFSSGSSDIFCSIRIPK